MIDNYIRKHLLVIDHYESTDVQSILPRMRWYTMVGLTINVMIALLVGLFLYTGYHNIKLPIAENLMVVVSIGLLYVKNILSRNARIYVGVKTHYRMIYQSIYAPLFVMIVSITILGGIAFRLFN